MFNHSLGREIEVAGYDFILFPIKPPQFNCIRSYDEWLGANSEFLSFLKSSLATSCVCELNNSFACSCDDSV